MTTHEEALEALITRAEESERKAAHEKAMKIDLLMSLAEHTGHDHGIMAIRSLVDRAEAAEAENARLRSALNLISHTVTKDSHGNIKDLPVAYYKYIARSALAARKDQSWEFAPSAMQFAHPADDGWPNGTIVRKKSGSWWEGRVVGRYSTEQTPDGYCVQLDRPNGPVQIYPASALEVSP